MSNFVLCWSRLFLVSVTPHPRYLKFNNTRLVCGAAISRPDQTLKSCQNFVRQCVYVSFCVYRNL